MKNKPLVTVICLCYNHENYVIEALNSVLNQTYPNVQLIVVDDASTDDSVTTIEEFVTLHPNTQFVKQEINVGNCTAFNSALKHVKGEYIIDLAADDILLPERVSEGVKTFEQHSDDYGINFTDAAYIDEHGKLIKQHYSRNNAGELIEDVPQGNVFKDVLQTYFICSPTTMIKKIVFDHLNGYDESLTYEDFDLWVRASRHWKFCYTDQILVYKRTLPQSHGQQQYKKGSTQMESTYLVCVKAYHLCESKEEFTALRKRIKYELKHAIWLIKLPLVMRYINLWVKSIR